MCSRSDVNSNMCIKRKCEAAVCSGDEIESKFCSWTIFSLGVAILDTKQ